MTDDRHRRRRTPGPGIPVEVDPELTPPPQEPPRASDVPGYDEIPYPIRRQFDALSTSIGEITRGLHEVWGARKDGDRFDKLESKLGTLASSASRHETMLYDTIWPAVQGGMAAHGAVAEQLPRVSYQLEQLVLRLDTLDARLRALEVDRSTASLRWDSTHAALASRVDGVETKDRNHEIRIAQLERDKRDGEVVNKAIAKRERLKSGGFSGFVAAVVAAVAAAISHFTK